MGVADREIVSFLSLTDSNNFETIGGSGIAPSLGNYKTPHESAKDEIRGE